VNEGIIILKDKIKEKKVGFFRNISKSLSNFRMNLFNI